jgi:hypothetical protein
MSYTGHKSIRLTIIITDQTKIIQEQLYGKCMEIDARKEMIIQVGQFGLGKNWFLNMYIFGLDRNVS